MKIFFATAIAMFLIQACGSVEDTTPTEVSAIVLYDSGNVTLSCVQFDGLTEESAEAYVEKMKQDGLSSQVGTCPSTIQDNKILGGCEVDQQTTLWFYEDELVVDAEDVESLCLRSNQKFLPLSQI